MLYLTVSLTRSVCPSTYEAHVSLTKKTFFLFIIHQNTGTAP